MKFLLTSAGISNASIHNALVELLGKPISESRALFIPTAIYSLPSGSDIAYRVIRGSLGDPFCEMGWKSLGVLELTALPSIKKERWLNLLQETDALLVGGGDCQYLTYWMQQTGLADLLPSLLSRTVYVGLSAGSMVMTSFGTTYGGHTLPAESDKSLGLIDIALHPHLDYETIPGKLPGQPGETGRYNLRAVVSDRRSDRNQSDRRHHRSRLRGELETLHSLTPMGSTS